MEVIWKVVEYTKELSVQTKKEIEKATNEIVQGNLVTLFVIRKRILNTLEKLRFRLYGKKIYK